MTCNNALNKKGSFRITIICLNLKEGLGSLLFK